MKVHVIVGSNGELGKALVDHYLMDSRNLVIGLDVFPSQKLSSENQRYYHVEASDFMDKDLSLPELLNRFFPETRDPTTPLNELATLTFAQAIPDPKNLDESISEQISENGARVPTNRELRRLWAMYTEQHILDQYKTTVVAMQSVLQLMLAQLEQSNDCSVILFGSVFGDFPLNSRLLANSTTMPFKPPGYTLAKSTQESHMRFLNELFSDTKVRFNMITPGPFSKISNHEILKNFQDATQSKELVSVEDIISLVIFLHSNMATKIRGANIEISNGWRNYAPF